MGEGLGNQVGFDFRIRLLPNHFDVAPQGDQRDPVIRHPDRLAEDPRAEAQRKFFHPHTEEPRHEKMAQLVEEDQDSQNDNKRKNTCTHWIFKRFPKNFPMMIGLR